MPHVSFARAFRRHVDCPDEDVDGASVREALGAYFARHPAVRTYVLDDTGAVRRHVVVFVGGVQISDPSRLTDAVAAGATIDVFQALSGGCS